MEFTFTPLRIAFLIALLVLFACLGGFSPVSGVPPKGWGYMVTLYVAGAVSATIVDHWVGNLDRSNLRLLYVIMGVLACGGGLMYLHILKSQGAMLH